MASSAPPPLHDDLSSLSNPHEVVVTHLDWKATVDFDEKKLVATATYSLDVLVAGSLLKLDTAHLQIESVTDKAKKPLPYTLTAGSKAHLGQCLEIQLKAKEKVIVNYQTTAASSALQWLPPSQTAGKVHPYLFTQCQAIHARTLVPCQDRPGVKTTFASKVTCPAWSTCVMSGLLQKTTTKKNGTKKEFSFHQPVPISSYLIAMAVGELEKHDISERCAVYSEPSVIKAAAYEFAQTEHFLQLAEDIAGMPYPWKRYDLLVLPPSFPYGGMENPQITFVTPTLLAGDQSLADVVAHEQAHSWTGNCVTNATWQHFWLNEGWTTWFQRKIMARIHGNSAQIMDLDAMGGIQTLRDTVKRMPDKFTSLVPILDDMDPDDCFSSVPYEKGFCLLYVLEQRVGTVEFEAFFQAYIKHFCHKTLDSNDFQQFFMQHFSGNPAVADFDWKTWFHAPGMAPELPVLDESLAQASKELASAWRSIDDGSTTNLPTTSLAKWTTAQIVTFLDTLLGSPQCLKLTTLGSIDKSYNFSKSHNSEILFRYCQLALQAGDESIIPTVARFITTQGRMKFVRPLYRSLVQAGFSALAKETFLKHQGFYHPICAKMVATDLASGGRGGGNNGRTKWFFGIGAVAIVAVVAIVVVRGSRRR